MINGEVIRFCECLSIFFFIFNIILDLGYHFFIVTCLNKSPLDCISICCTTLQLKRAVTLFLI